MTCPLDKDDEHQKRYIHHKGKSAQTRKRLELYRSFWFAKYLRRCTRDTIASLLSVSFPVWVIIFLLIACNLTRVVAGAVYHTVDHGVMAFLLCGYLLLIAFIVSYIWMRRKLLKYYEALKMTCPAEPLPPSDTETEKPSYEHAKLFIGGSPKFDLAIIQMLIVLNSLYLTFYVLVFCYRISCYQAAIVQFIAVIPPILIMFCLLPLLLPIFSLLSHVEHLTHEINREYVLFKMMEQEQGTRPEHGRRREAFTAQALEELYVDLGEVAIRPHPLMPAQSHHRQTHPHSPTDIEMQNQEN